MRSVLERRLSRVLLAAGLLTAVIAVPAIATPADDDGSHTIEICHVSNSETNQFILITVDVAAFDLLDANDHSLHTNKDGKSDFAPEPGAGCYDTDGPDE